jgi:hypothetical protein
MDGISTRRMPLEAPATAALDRPPREPLDGPTLPAEERATRLRGQEWVERYWALPLYAVLFLLVYAPCLMMTYGYADDYNFLYDFSTNPRPIFLEIAFGGRPVEALLMFTIGLLGHVGRLRFMRLIAILGIGLLAWLLHRALRSVHSHPMIALCAPVIMCTLPPIALYTAWSLGAFWPSACVLSGLAVLALERKVLPQLPHVPSLVVALAVQTIATMIYQPAAMMFWAFAAIYLLLPNQTPRELLKRLLTQGFVVVGALAIDFAFTKSLPLFVAYNTPVAGRSTLFHDPIAKAHWFLKTLVEALNLWSLAPSIRRAELVLAFVVVGLLVYFRGTWQQRGMRLAIAGALLPLAVLPNLLVAENGTAYRFEDALTALIGLYLALAIVGYARVFVRAPRLAWSTASTWKEAPGYARALNGRVFARISGLPWSTVSSWILVRGVAIILFLVTAASCLSANNTVNSEIVFPNTLAYLVIQRGIVQANLNRPVAHVYVVRISCPIDSPAALLSNEYGRASTAIDWAVPQMVYLALRDLDPTLTDVRVLVAEPGQEIAVPAGAAVIDTRELGFYSHARTPEKLNALGCLPQGE